MVQNYNLITGKLQNLQSTPLTADEMAAFNRWFTRLVAQKGEIDLDIAASFEKQKDFYASLRRLPRATLRRTTCPSYLKSRPAVPSASGKSCQ
jgi:hypothetical protein